MPPNWFGIAAFGFLGAFVSPGLWLIGLGIEGLYLWALTRNSRFRATVDAATVGAAQNASRYENLLTHLDSQAQSLQHEVEQEAAEIVALLQRSQAHNLQIEDVRQMAWLHLKLLAARAAMLKVIDVARSEHGKLEEQERRCRERLAGDDTDEELRRSLQQQIEVIGSRQAAHADAQRRRELVDAELGRLRQQVSLVREQALLATDENSLGKSLDAVSASLNEANRWLKDQQELFAGLDSFTGEPPPADLLASKRNHKRASRISD